MKSTVTRALLAVIVLMAPGLALAPTTSPAAHPAVLAADQRTYTSGRF